MKDTRAASARLGIMAGMRRLLRSAAAGALSALLLASTAWGAVCKYVVDQRSHTFSVQEPDGGAVTAHLALADRPLWPQIRPDGRRVYVTDASAGPSGGVWIVDTASNTIIDTILTGRQPVDVAFAADGSRMYVVTSYVYATNGAILVVDVATNQILYSIPAPGAGAQRSIVLNPAGTRAYVTSPESNLLAVVDLEQRTTVASLKLETSPRQLSLSADGATLSVLTAVLNSAGYDIPTLAPVVVIDTATMTVTATLDTARTYFPSVRFPPRTEAVAEIPYSCWGAGPTPTATATPIPPSTPAPRWSPIPTAAVAVLTPSPVAGHDYVYIADRAADAVSVVDAAAATVVTNIALGSKPNLVSATADGRFVLVTYSTARDLTIIDTMTNTVAANVNVGFAAEALLLAPDGRTVYVVADRYAATVNLSNPGVTGSLVLPSTSGALAAAVLTPDGQEICAAWSETVYDPLHSEQGNATRLFCLDLRSGETQEVLLQGGSPRGLAISPDGERLYITRIAVPLERRATPTPRGVSHLDAASYLTVVDIWSRSVVAESIIESAGPIVVSPNGAWLYVAGERGVYPISTDGPSAPIVIATASRPGGLAVNADSSTVYATDPATYRLLGIDAAAAGVSMRTAVLAQPLGLAVVRRSSPLPSPTPTVPPASPPQPCALSTVNEWLAIFHGQSLREVADIKVGSPLAFTVAGRQAYVLRYLDETGSYDLAVVDLGRHAVVAEIPLPASSSRLLAAHDERSVYVISATNLLSTFDVAEGRLTDSISLEAGNLSDLVLTSDDALLYGVGSVCRTPVGCRIAVVELDRASGRLRRSIDLGHSPIAAERIVLSADGQQAFVPLSTGTGEAKVMVIDLRDGAVVRSIDVADYAGALAVHPDGSRLYVLGNAVHVFDIASGAAIAEVSAAGRALTFLPDGRYAFLGMQSGFVVFDTLTNQIGEEVAPYGNPPLVIEAAGVCDDPRVLTPRPTRTPTSTDVPTLSPTETPTVTPTRTPRRVPQIALTSASGPAGATLSVSAVLHSFGEAIAGIENDIVFDPQAAIAVAEDGRPSCSVNAAIHKSATGFSFLPAGCVPGVSCRRVRAIVVATDNLEPIADGAILYTCTLHTADATAGEYPLALTGVTASSPRGSTVLIVTRDGQVVIHSATASGCAGDCDYSGAVYVDEIITGCRIVLDESPMSACPPADSDGDGKVMVDEVMQAVNNALDACHP